jgi:hypothetical protein
MVRSQLVLASGLCTFTGMALAGITSAGAQVVYADEGAYTVPPAYVAPAVPPDYYVAPQGYYYMAPQGYVAAVPTYTAPATPLAVVPVAPPAYAAVPPYVERVVPPITPRERATRRVIERRPAYPRDDYGYVTYDEW